MDWCRETSRHILYMVEGLRGGWCLSGSVWSLCDNAVSRCLAVYGLGNRMVAPTLCSLGVVMPVQETPAFTLTTRIHNQDHSSHL